MQKAKNWNRNNFGNIFRRKERIFRRLQGIDKAIASGSPKSCDDILQSLWREYDEIVIQKEIDWAQIAHCNWLAMGDKNTRFFHESAKLKKKRMRFDMLKDDNGSWISDQDKLRDMAVNFFKSLYSEDCNVAYGSLHTINRFTRLEGNTISFIQRVPLNHEIKEVVFSMGGIKAPVPDGLHALFFQSQWDTVGPAVCDFVRQVFGYPDCIMDVNETLLVLIPKTDNPETIKQFHPISLCEVIYKVVTKLIASRIKSHMNHLIGPNQCSFISGRTVMIM